MTVYADYEFYEKEYLSGRKAAVTVADFPFFMRQASTLIEQYTYGRVSTDSVPDEVKHCACELAEVLFRTSQTADNTGVSSESVQGWSRSYESGESRRKALRQSQKECIDRWLSNTGLLYSGVF